VTTFDRLDWHLDAALERGQPPENAFAHIGLYVAWLIRHHLVDPSAIPRALADAVVAGELRGSDLRDALDDALTSDAMTDEGAAFTDWYYATYLDDYGSAFADRPDYAVADDAAAYDRIAPTIDRRYTEWLALGAPDEAATPFTVRADEIAELTPVELDAVARELADAIAGDDMAADNFGEEFGSDEQLEVEANGSPHDAPDLEALLPAAIGGTRLQITSARASDWQSSLLRRAIENVGAGPTESFVALGLGGVGADSLAVTLYAIPGVPQDRLEAEFSRDVYLAPGQHWERREVGGKAVWWAAAEQFDTAFYALGGLVVTAGGSEERVRAALDVLP
jgi:hypothetical protein